MCVRFGKVAGADVSLCATNLLANLPLPFPMAFVFKSLDNASRRRRVRVLDLDPVRLPAPACVYGDTRACTPDANGSAGGLPR